MIQGKKFISPGAWFTMVYPSDWNEFEDGEGSFLFYNPDTWTGNFRISAFKADLCYTRRHGLWQRSCEAGAKRESFGFIGENRKISMCLQ